MSNLIKTNKLAKLLSVTMHTVRDMRDAGLLPNTITVGKSQLWVESEIDSWLKNKLAARNHCNIEMVDSLPWPPVLLESKQIAKIFGIAISSVYKYVKAGKLPTGIVISKNNSYRWVKSEVDDCINRLLSEREGIDGIPCSPVFINANELAIKLGFSSSDHINRLNRDAQLPKEITFCTKKLWVESEIDEWIKRGIADRDAAVAGSMK